MTTLPTPESDRDPAPRKRRKNAKEVLLQAASDLLKARHAIDISFSEIAEASGLNSALIKYHFGNKDGLLLALVERDAAKTMATMEQLVAMDISPREKIRLHIAGVINTYAKHPYLNRLIHTLMDSKSSSVSQEMVEFFVKPLMDAETQILKEGVAKGDFREVDPTLFYYSVVGACDYIFYARHSRKLLTGATNLTPAVRDNYIEFVSEMVLKMLDPK
ncbi:TetR family transcriptional regulator [Spongiibacter taiwanensis]|uniref:TetR family transcriptional regulator n=1 Tax=Spongiibacter taiwanensis TaxID=1748242 RepID=UPI002034AE2D|nr:TetR family transcriptional regulator [Spongiibacter taiwanensis]USA42865.1 TetR family transcriptional regulator [Spongiibacter taiwanensis]